MLLHEPKKPAVVHYVKCESPSTASNDRFLETGDTNLNVRGAHIVF